MSPGWQRAGELFDAAAELPAEARAGFLDRECGGDAALRAEVESLLAADSAAGPLDVGLQLVPAAAGGGDGSAGPDPSPGSRVVAHYRLGERLGGGGMGVVYRAEDLRLERTVALKFLSPDRLGDADAKARFLREARSASQLDHPNICTVYEIGEAEDGQLYIAMAFYDGETLKTKVERGPLPVDEAVRIAADVARGLAKAHAAGIVHRDVKPANLMVTADGVVKIVDFGLAKVVGRAGVTRSGALLGTAAYMAPEQIRGEPVGPAADLFALGVVLYELLTGNQPFQGDREHGIIYAILEHEPPPIGEARPEVPAELERIVARLLRKDPRERTASARELLTELSAVVPLSGSTAGGRGTGETRVMYPAADPRIRQSVRFLRTADGLRLAWAEAGSGRPFVKASNWLTHLEYEWESPVWRHWMHFFASRYRFIRYDERGCGMTDWDVRNLSLETWLGDLETVIGAAKPEGPIILLGISQGSAAAIAYAVRHPERVSHLILYGAYALGALLRGEAEERRFRAITEIMRVGFGSDNAAFRQVFTSRFIPGGTDEQIRWFNELCAKTVSPENAARLMEARGAIDVTALLPQVRTPTLVLHGRNDDITPVAQGRLLAAGIPGAEFVELDSRNHVLLADEPAWRRFCDAVLGFTGVGG